MTFDTIELRFKWVQNVFLLRPKLSYFDQFSANVLNFT